LGFTHISSNFHFIGHYHIGNYIGNHYCEETSIKPAEFLMCFEKYSPIINVGDGPYRVGIIDKIGI